MKTCRFLFTEYEMPNCLCRLNMQLSHINTCYVGECNYSNSQTQMVIRTDHQYLTSFEMTVSEEIISHFSHLLRCG